MAKRKAARPSWTPNQVVAYNIAKARLLRGWTQAEAGEHLAPYLGQRLSTASWSAMERSVDGGRIREFSADELVGFARGFDLPIGWFLTPPPVDDGIDIAVPGTKHGRLDPAVLLDLVLGTPESVDAWRAVLLNWPSAASTMRIGSDGASKVVSGPGEDVHQRLDTTAVLRAQTLLREQFGDLEAARTVLVGLADLLSALDEPTATDTP